MSKTLKEALSAARSLVARDFPRCTAAFLAGSVVRGEATVTSDLDIVILMPAGQSNFRKSFHAFGWPVEVFVHTPESFRQFNEQEVQRRRPSLAMMCCEGILLVDQDGLGRDLKVQACELLEEGPQPLSETELALVRYGLTDMLDDFMGSTRPGELLFLANDLVVDAGNLILDHHRHWRGQGKWLLRALNRFDPQLSRDAQDVLQTFYQTADKIPLVSFVDRALDLVGGRLWDGFSLGND